MTSEFVTCVVPVRDGEAFLAETIESVLGQTYTERELIVVDDGSSDGSAAVAAGYDEVRVASQPPLGHAAARNHGIREAVGDLLAFLDADDLWRPEKLERQITRFRERPELDVCVTHMHFFWPAHLAAEEATFRARADVDVPGYGLSTAMVRRSTFDRFGVLDEDRRHSATADWFVRVRDGGGVIELLPDILVDRRMHENSVSRKGIAVSHDEHLHLLKARLDRLRGRAGDDR